MIEAIRKCQFFFEVLSLKLADVEDCDALPESSDPNVCIGQMENNSLQKVSEIKSKWGSTCYIK